MAKVTVMAYATLRSRLHVFPPVSGG